MFKSVCLFILILHYSLIVQSQESYFVKIQNLDGLATKKVYCSFEDANGYIWFGTDLGASRFNGYEIENFDDNNGLEGNEIFSIYQDSQNRLWFLSYNGKITYYRNDSFHNSSNTKELQSLRGQSHFSSICEDSLGTIYLSTYSGEIFILDLTGNLTNCNLPCLIYNIWLGEDNQVYALGSKGVFQIDGNNGTLRMSMPLDKYYPRSLYHDGVLYFGYGNSLYSMQNEIIYLNQMSASEEITWLGMSDTDKLEIGTRNGLYIYSLANNKIEPNFSLKDHVITSTFHDSDNGFWVTTEGEGCYYKSSPSIKVYNSKNLFPNDQVTCLHRSEDRKLWVGFSDGIYGTLYKSEFKSSEKLGPRNLPVTKIKELTNGTKIIMSKSVSRIIEAGIERYFSYPINDILHLDTLVYLASKKVHKIPSATFFNNLQKARRPTQELEIELSPNILLRKSSKTLCLGNDGEIYIGTQQGLFKIQADTLYCIAENDSRLSSSINDICYDSSRDLMYVATNNEGLLVLRRDSVISSFNENSGLLNNHCQNLFLDTEKSLWLSTTSGLSRIIPMQDGYEILNCSQKIGLKTPLISDIERIDDEIYLATDEGMITFSLKDINGHNRKPILQLHSFMANSIAKQITDGDMLLDYTQNSISINFLGLSPGDMGNLTYHYSLNIDNELIEATTSGRRINFESLKSGEYQFTLKAVRPNGVESDPISIRFTILQPFWKEIWFNLTLAGLFLIASFLIVISRLRKLKNKYESEKEFTRIEIERIELEKAYLLAEQRAGVMQMNPHFLFNSLNTIKGFYAQHKFSEANQYISRFSRLLRKILEIDTQLISVSQEVEILELYLGLMQKRYDGLFDFKINANIKTPELTMIPPMILQPLVENAVIHGLGPIEQGTVQVDFEINHECLICTVFDDGVGYNKSKVKSHNPVGLKNIEDRLGILSKQFNFPCRIEILSPISADQNGTLIKLQLPIKQRK